MLMHECHRILFFTGRPAGSPNLLTSAFDCGASFEIDLELMCDGIDDCVTGVTGAGTVRSGSDEISGICDSKQ